MKKAKYKAVTFDTPQQLYKALYSGRVIIVLPSCNTAGEVITKEITLYEHGCKIYPTSVNVERLFWESDHFVEEIGEEAPVRWEDSLGSHKYENGILCEVSLRYNKEHGAVLKKDYKGYHTNTQIWDNARPLTKEEALSMVYTEE